MKLEGDYLYTNGEERIAFIYRWCEYDSSDSGKGWWTWGRLSFGLISRFSDFRISRYEAREALRYLEGEPWCGITQVASTAEQDCLAVGESSCHPVLHKSAVYLVNNADEFRELYEWLKE